MLVFKKTRKLIQFIKQYLSISLSYSLTTISFWEEYEHVVITVGI